MDEVGKNPPGDEIDGLESPSPGEGWVGRGFNVRQGAVIAKAEYSCSEDSEVPGRLMDITKMVVERVQSSPHFGSARLSCGTVRVGGDGWVPSLATGWK